MRNRNIETSPHSVNDDSSHSVPMHFLSPRPPSSQRKDMRWNVSIADRILWGQLKLLGGTSLGEPSVERTEAWSVFSSLSFSILSPACVHPSKSSAGTMGPLFYFHGLEPRRMSLVEEEEVRILINARGVFGRQLYAHQKLHYRFPDRHYITVIHNEGCLECALRLCLSLKCRAVIS